jgi:hypothetical protein
MLQGKLEWGDWSGNDVLPYIVGMDGDLIVSCHQVDLGEDGTIEKLLGIIMDMTDGVAVLDDPSV